MKYTIDVPVTLSVTVERQELTAQQAKDIARRFAEGVDLDYAEAIASFNYTNQLIDSAHPRILVALEFSSEVLREEP